MLTYAYIHSFYNHACIRSKPLLSVDCMFLVLEDEEQRQFFNLPRTTISEKFDSINSFGSHFVNSNQKEKYLSVK